MMKEQIKLLIISTIVLTSSCTAITENKIKQLPKSLEIVIEDLAHYNFEDIQEVEFLKNYPMSNSTIEKLNKDFNLCNIDKYQMGISFHFECIDKLSRSPNYSDREYYLIKVIDINEKDNFLGYAQYVDCGKKAEPLKNNWYFVRKNLKCD